MQTVPPNYIAPFKPSAPFWEPVMPSNDIDPIIMFLIRIRIMQSITIPLKGQLGTNKSQHDSKRQNGIPVKVPIEAHPAKSVTTFC